MKYKPKPRFASGFLVPDGKSARRTLVGRLFPQPFVRTAAGQRVLLDEVLGNRFALVALTSGRIGYLLRSGRRFGKEARRNSCCTRQSSG